MNNCNELIGQLVEYRSESFNEFFQMMKPNPVALGLVVEIEENVGFKSHIRVEWLVNPHQYTLFNVSEINKFGLTLKDNEDWGL